jgi:tRNA modification GTPase
MTGPRETIFALSSGRGPAAIAVVRLSGPQARFGLETLISRLPEPRTVGLRKLLNPQTKEVLDEALVLWFPGPRTETGEDMVELHLHGGRAVVAAVLEVLGTLDGLRPAEAGEFTRRAFANGKLDLTAVEGLADLVTAETEAQRAQAMRQYRGLLAGRADTWRERLIGAMALVEAGIDFSDEADVPADLIAPALATARELADEIAAALADGRRGERLRDGLVVAIAGPPNAGKSSLLNRIAQRDVAIVSPHAGTTRDVIEVHLDLQGYPVTLLDTAGIRDSDDPVEQEGVRRAQARAADADLILWLSDATAPGETPPRKNEPVPIWWVRNKVDLAGGSTEPGFETSRQRSFAISALHGTGVDDLIVELSRHAASVLRTGESVLITRERHRGLLQDAVDALHRALTSPRDGAEDLIAEELRLAARALGRLTGRVDVEDLLDVIFRDFCIGK